MSGFTSVLVGDGLLLAQCGEMLLKRGHDITFIATESPQIEAWASVRQIATSSMSELERKLVDLQVDWLFSIANLRPLSAKIIEHPRRGAINFHDAMLPDQAGLNTPAWAILEGRTVHGVTWHQMTPKIDQGEIFIREDFDIAPDETAFTLNSKCFEAGIDTFEELVGKIENGTLTAQAEATPPQRLYRKSMRPEAAGTLDFAKSADALSRLVRALDFGEAYANPLVTPKIRHAGNVYHVGSLLVEAGLCDRPAGTVLAVAGDAVTIATADHPVLVTAFQSRNGVRVPLARLVQPGDRLSLWTPQQAEALSAAVAAVTPSEQDFLKALQQRVDAVLPDLSEHQPDREPLLESMPLACCDGRPRSERVALICAFISRLCGQTIFDVALSQDRLSHTAAVWPDYFSSSVPLRVDLSEARSPQQVIDLIDRRLSKLDRQLTYLEDLTERHPGTANTPLTFAIVDARIPPLAQPIPGCAVTFRIGSSNCELIYDRRRLDSTRAAAMAARLEIFAGSFHDEETDLARLALMGEEERNRVLYEWNRTEKDYEQHACVHQLIERQAQLTPTAEAVSSGNQTLTYEQLNRRAEALATVLAAHGVGPENIVGLHLPRSVDLVVAALAIWKAGGAYLPLDPDFPPDRLAFMIEDSRMTLAICNQKTAANPALDACERLLVTAAETDAKTEAAPNHAKADNLAYVIYTSGSTGKPKGVMIEHCNVVNFFAGMDERIPMLSDRRNVWLAVTSLSFDISVLELFWTLSRGFHVVLHTPEISRAKAAAAAPVRDAKQLSFGLFYWGNDSSSGPNKYRLLMEGAKFADNNGFDAVWTPERHFHAFGGPFPNPAVSGAAVAAVTKNVAIRAGSCVLPLHHSIRVAEEWAVVDNLSNGRVGLAFASGWMPEDFVLRPENTPPHNKSALIRELDVVRKLWRGEKLPFTLGNRDVEVLTQPRPVQSELPVWLTTAGNPQSYRDAAAAGAHVLTHLLGQSIDELGEKIALYRKELAAAGRDPSAYKVTLMLHTLIGEDREAVRALARGPLKAYLQSAAALIKQYAWAFPAFKKPAGTEQADDIDLRTLTADDMDAILDHAFNRYFDESGLFGTIEDARERLVQLQQAGVDDIACLIDWGLPDDIVLDGLRPLAKVISPTRQSAVDSAASFAEEIARHKVTHLQCTPSMMRAFMMSEEDRAALGQIAHILLGGEALPGALVAALRRCTQATIENMYGPTETTIWSSSCTAQSVVGTAPIGRAIANTQLYVLDANLEPVPPGDAGELYIGGDGVARGYLHREALTAERFLPNRFARGRMYRTGDVARFDGSGILHFLGRNDQQVKIRGHRIELGEVEAVVGAYPGVTEAVVIARKDTAADPQLVAYVRSAGERICEEALLDYLRTRLPDSMLPSAVVAMEQFPLTPNAKVDRNRLPAPKQKVSPVLAPFVEPSGDLEVAIGAVFAQTLGRERVGRQENFFAIGGHSLLAVQMHRQLKAHLAPDLTITDLFRFPTVAALAGHVSGNDGTQTALGKAADRAAQRRQMLQERQSRTVRADALV